ncbi:hypothetical protein PS15m_000072 [Mucor circinelloides]
MSDLATQQPNRSVRRQLTREQSKRERKEEKKLKKNAPDSVRFNSKKSRKVVPYNPIKAALIEKDTATPKKKNNLSAMFVPVVVTDKFPATTGAAKMPENTSEVILPQKNQSKEQPEEQKRKEEGEEEEEEVYIQQQEPLLPVLSSSPLSSQEEALKEIPHQSTANEDEVNASDPVAAQNTVLNNDKSEPVSINQSDVEGNNDDETKSEAIATPAVSAPGSDDDPIDKYDEAENESHLVTTTTISDETNVADTNKEIKEEIQQITQQQEHKKTKEEEETMLQKDTTPAPSTTTSASISDKISPSTSTSSNKRKSTLISRLFKHKNSSKKEVNVIQDPALVSKEVLSEKKKKSKAWKIWKKL